MKQKCLHKNTVLIASHTQTRARATPPELELRCEAEMSFHVLHKKVARSAIWHYQGLFHLDLKSARPTFGKIRFITHFPSAKQNIHGSFIIIYAAKTHN